MGVPIAAEPALGDRRFGSCAHTAGLPRPPLPDQDLRYSTSFNGLLEARVRVLRIEEGRTVIRAGSSIPPRVPRTRSGGSAAGWWTRRTQATMTPRPRGRGCGPPATNPRYGEGCSEA